MSLVSTGKVWVLVDPAPALKRITDVTVLPPNGNPVFHPFGLPRPRTVQSRNFGTPSFSPLPGSAISVEVPWATSSPAPSCTLASV